MQKFVPRTTEWKPHRYRAPEYLVAKENRRQRKYALRARPVRRSDSPSSSEDSFDDDDKQYENDQCFWNESELIKMQLDEGSADREYVKLTVTRTDDK